MKVFAALVIGFAICTLIVGFITEHEPLMEYLKRRWAK